MDHLVFPDTGSNELENLINRNKSMIIRGAAERRLPYGKVNEGDVLYFINNIEDNEVIASGVVNYVLNSDRLSFEESFETVIRYQYKLQLPDQQFRKIAGKGFLVLIGLDKTERISPFRIDRSDFTIIDNWITLGKIEKVVISDVY